MDDNDKNNVNHELSVQLLTDIVTEASFNAQSGDPLTALQGRQTKAIALILLNLLGTVEPETFDNTPPPVPAPVDNPPVANPTEQTGDGTVVKAPDQVVGQAPAAPNNAALGPDTSDVPANADNPPVVNPAAVDTLSGATTPDNTTPDNVPTNEQTGLDLNDPNAPPPDSDTTSPPGSDTTPLPGSDTTSPPGSDTVPNDSGTTAEQANNAADDTANNGGLNNGNFVSG